MSSEGWGKDPVSLLCLFAFRLRIRSLSKVGQAFTYLCEWQMALRIGQAEGELRSWMEPIRMADPGAHVLGS